MENEQSRINAERARQLARDAQKRALDHEVPRVMSKIMARIERASNFGKMNVSFMLDDVYLESDGPAGLVVGDMLNLVLSQLDEQGFNVKMSADVNLISVSWHD